MWRADSRELFFVGDDRRFYVVRIPESGPAQISSRSSSSTCTRMLPTRGTATFPVPMASASSSTWCSTPKTRLSTSFPTGARPSDVVLLEPAVHHLRPSTCSMNAAVPAVRRPCTSKTVMSPTARCVISTSNLYPTATDWSRGLTLTLRPLGWSPLERDDSEPDCLREPEPLGTIAQTDEAAIDRAGDFSNVVLIGERMAALGGPFHGGDNQAPQFRLST